MRLRIPLVVAAAVLAAGALPASATASAPAASAPAASAPAVSAPVTPSSLDRASFPTLATLPGTALPLPSFAGSPGARVPFTEYEAENAHTNGTVLGADRAFTHLAAEASGRRAVSLAAGQYVDFVLAKPASAVDIRYSVVDQATSTLHLSTSGASLGDLTLTSTYSHVYGNYPFTKNAAEGGEHHYFDDVRTMFGRTLPAGTRVRMQVSAAAVIDLADFEAVAPPVAPPAGYLNVTDFGADPTGSAEGGQAIQDAIDAAEAQHVGVWIPAGTFKVTRQLVVDQVTVRGAGPWRSVLSGAGVGIFGKAAPTPSGAVHLADFAIFGGTTMRNDSTSDSGLGGSLGAGSTVDNLWIEHTKVGIWFDGPVDGLTVRGLRIQNTFADGINLHNGVSHVTVSNTFVRNTGDDGMAMWSDQNADHDNAFTHNTVSVPLLANGYGLYGGHDNTISDNIAADTVTQGGGVHVGNRFGSVPLAGTTTITGDLLVRTGDLVPNDPTQIGALWFYAADSPMTGTVDVSHETLVDNSYSGVQFVGRSISNVHVDHVAILGARTFAVQVQSPGSATFAHVTAIGLGAAGVYDCASGFALTRGPGNVGWSSTACGLPAAGQLQIAQSTGINFGFQALNASATLPIALTNPGPKPITITSATPPNGFAVANSCGTIAVGATCTLNVVFTPTTSANFAGLLTIDSTSPAGPYVVAVSGVGFDPDGNLALGRQVTSSSQAADFFGPYRLVDGDASTYFESADGSFPQTVTLDLGEAFSIDRIVLRLPTNWGGRTETLSVSADGAPLVGAADYSLDPDTGNVVTIAFPATSARTVTLTFTANTGWPAAQISEFEVYAH